MAETINWTACDVKLGDLKPWDRNPKSISKNHARRLIEYWQRIGQFQTIAIGPGGEVYDGHQRLSCLLSVYGADYEVQALRSSRALTDEERRELVIAAHVGTTGQFNWDELANWDPGELQEWGLDGETLQDWKNGIAALLELLEDGDDDDGYYTSVIQSPVYEPKGEKPDIAQLYDDAKTRMLLQEIETADITDDEKSFLRVAANRHTVIDYRNVAEYYAHASPAMQRLMENSALVIIDFNRAIELGYVRLTQELIELYRGD